MRREMDWILLCFMHHQENYHCFYYLCYIQPIYICIHKVMLLQLHLTCSFNGWIYISLTRNRNHPCTGVAEELLNRTSVVTNSTTVGKIAF